MNVDLRVISAAESVASSQSSSDASAVTNLSVIDLLSLTGKANGGLKGKEQIFYIPKRDGTTETQISTRAYNLLKQLGNKEEINPSDRDYLIGVLDHAPGIKRGYPPQDCDGDRVGLHSRNQSDSAFAQTGELHSGNSHVFVLEDNSEPPTQVKSSPSRRSGSVLPLLGLDRGIAAFFFDDQSKPKHRREVGLLKAVAGISLNETEKDLITWELLAQFADEDNIQRIWDDSKLRERVFGEAAFYYHDYCKRQLGTDISFLKSEVENAFTDNGDLTEAGKARLETQLRLHYAHILGPDDNTKNQIVDFLVGTCEQIEKTSIENSLNYLVEQTVGVKLVDSSRFKTYGDLLINSETPLLRTDITLTAVMARDPEAVKLELLEILIPPNDLHDGDREAANQRAREDLANVFKSQNLTTRFLEKVQDQLGIVDELKQRRPAHTRRNFLAATAATAAAATAAWLGLGQSKPIEPATSVSSPSNVGGPQAQALAQPQPTLVAPALPALQLADFESGAIDAGQLKQFDLTNLQKAIGTLKELTKKPGTNNLDDLKSNLFNHQLLVFLIKLSERIAQFNPKATTINIMASNFQSTKPASESPGYLTITRPTADTVTVNINPETIGSGLDATELLNSALWKEAMTKEAVARTSLPQSVTLKDLTSHPKLSLKDFENIQASPEDEEAKLLLILVSEISKLNTLPFDIKGLGVDPSTIKMTKRYPDKEVLISTESNKAGQYISFNPVTKTLQIDIEKIRPITNRDPATSATMADIQRFTDQLVKQVFSSLFIVNPPGLGVRAGNHIAYGLGMLKPPAANKP